MAMIAMVSAKAAPGVTTTIALLASHWPGPVIAVDADPAGGDLAFGWLGSATAAGLIRSDRGVLSFIEEVRQRGAEMAPPVQRHLQRVPDRDDVDVLVGFVRRPYGWPPVRAAEWRLLAQALGRLDTVPSTEFDVLVDCGRYGPETPWPLLDQADLVLIGTRPQRRHLHAAAGLVTTLRSRVPPERLGLAVCATGGGRTPEAHEVLGLPARLELPDDLAAARVYSDGRVAVRRRPRLVRAAELAAARLRVELAGASVGQLAAVVGPWPVAWPTAE